MRLRLIGASLLLTFCLAEAFADPGGSHRDRHGAVRVYQVQNIALERGDQRNDQQAQQPMERRRGREFGLPDTSGYSAQGEHQSNPAFDNARKQGRLTPEERRALRRQIDEVGHDIYAPKR